MGNNRSKPQKSAPTKAQEQSIAEIAKTSKNSTDIKETNKNGGIFFTAVDRIRTFLLCSMRAQNQQSAFYLSLMYRERSIALRILHYIFTELEACMPFTNLRKQLEPVRYENTKLESVDQFTSQSLRFPLIRSMLLLMRQNLPLREPLYDAILTLRVYTILDNPQWIWKVPSVFGSPECFVSHDIAYIVLAAMDQHHNDEPMQVLGLETLNALCYRQRSATVETKVYTWISGLKHRLAQNVGPPGHTISIWKFKKLVVHAYRCWRQYNRERLPFYGGDLLEDSDLYPHNSQGIRSWFYIASYFFDTSDKSSVKEVNGLRVQVHLLT